MGDDNRAEGKQAKDYSKKVSPDDLVRISEKLNEKSWGQENDTCPVCGSPHNTVLETEYSIPVSQREPLVGIGTHIPSYATACVNCGHLRFFSKVILDRMIAADAATLTEGGQEDG